MVCAIITYLLTAFLVNIVESDGNVEPSELPVFTLQPDCGMMQLDGFVQGIISSQPSGARYAPNTNCRCNVDVRRVGYVIQFTVKQLNLQAPSSNGTCLDSVTILDVTSNNLNPPLTPQMCGTTAPSGTYTTSTSKGVVLFNTDNYMQSDGFQIIFQRVSKSGSSSNGGVVEGCQGGSCGPPPAATSSASSDQLSHLGFVLLLCLLTLLKFS